jgi:hypothetical protein
MSPIYLLPFLASASPDFAIYPTNKRLNASQHLTQAIVIPPGPVATINDTPRRCYPPSKEANDYIIQVLDDAANMAAAAGRLLGKVNIDFSRMGMSGWSLVGNKMRCWPVANDAGYLCECTSLASFAESDEKAITEPDSPVIPDVDMPDLPDLPSLLGVVTDDINALKAQISALKKKLAELANLEDSFLTGDQLDAVLKDKLANLADLDSTLVTQSQLDTAMESLSALPSAEDLAQVLSSLSALPTKKEFESRLAKMEDTFLTRQQLGNALEPFSSLPTIDELKETLSPVLSLPTKAELEAQLAALEQTLLSRSKLQTELEPFFTSALEPLEARLTSLEALTENLPSVPAAPTPAIPNDMEPFLPPTDLLSVQAAFLRLESLLMDHKAEVRIVRSELDIVKGQTTVLLARDYASKEEVIFANSRTTVLQQQVDDLRLLIANLQGVISATPQAPVVAPVPVPVPQAPEPPVPQVPTAPEPEPEQQQPGSFFPFGPGNSPAP